VARAGSEQRATPVAPADEGWGPEIEQGTRRRRTGRALRRTLVVVLVVALVLGLALPWLVSTRIPRVEVDALASSGRPMHVLITGSDSRAGLTREEQNALSTGRDDGSDERTDTILLMTIQGGDVALLSFPRDLWVERCDGSMGRINVAQAIDGPGCLVDTVRRLSGIDVQHYIGVTFGGFVEVVDAVDGVEVCLEEPINDRDAGIDLPAGCQVLDGGDALGYVRVRKIDNDLQRVQRQQAFVQALAREIAQPSTLLNPVKVWELSGSAGGAVVADQRLGPIDLVRLGIGARGLASGAAVTHTVPTDPRTTTGGAAVLEARASEADALFARFASGAVLDDTGAAIAPADIRVEVLNGAQVDGLAGRVGGLLEDRGYDVAGLGNTEVRERTVIRHPPGQRAAAERLVADLPTGASIEESTEVSVVTILLGRDAAGRA
jgi:LCP family protein required for cell wall assembly